MQIRTFISSSSEAIELMDTIACWIEEFEHKPLKWNEIGLFPIGKNILETLIKLSNDVEAAIFIFNEDDKILCRESEVGQPRDNVIFEYGLFAGRLGTSNAIVCINGDPKILVDVQGIKYVNISPTHKERAKKEIKMWLSEINDSTDGNYKEGSSKDIKVHSHCGDLGDDKWVKMIDGAKEKIDILSYSFHSTLRNIKFVDMLKNAISNSDVSSIRIVLAHPDSFPIKQRKYSLTYSKDDLNKNIEASLGQLLSIYDSLEFAKEKLHINTVYDISLPYSMIRVDDDIHVIPYLSSMEKRDSILLSFSKSPLFDTYLTDFESIWRKSYSIFNQRSKTPNEYLLYSSEKDMISKSVLSKLNKLPKEPKIIDVGCGDGQQSILILNELSQFINIGIPIFLDPSTFAISVLEYNLVRDTNKGFYDYEIIPKRWQEYKPSNKYDFIFCSHVIGSIYKQCFDGNRQKQEINFSKHFLKFLDNINIDGIVCIVQASIKSTESIIRMDHADKFHKTLPKIMSAERFENYLKKLKKVKPDISYERVKIDSYLYLSAWLNDIGNEVSSIEKDMFYFLFSPTLKIEQEYADYYRAGLLKKSQKWCELSVQEKECFIANNECRNVFIDDDGRLVKMHHIAFFIKRSS